MNAPLCFQNIVLHSRYATNRNDLITEFYAPCLSCATNYDRAVGYFRSSILFLAAQPIADFAVRGGQMRLVCSPELTMEDIAALDKGYQWREAIGRSLLRSIESFLSDPNGRPLAEFLATLVAVGCLDIHIAFRPGAQGIFHDKIGVLYDSDGHSLSFTGSANETLTAWDSDGNHESFDVFCSWAIDGPRVESHTHYFDSLWRGEEPGVETINFPDVARDRLIRLANPSGVNAAHQHLVIARSLKTPRPYQIAAIQNWKLRGYRGILQHATGSGKTITAITAIREWLLLGYPVLVLVPSDLLLVQWYREILVALTDLQPKIVLVGGGHNDWRQLDVLEGFSISDPKGGRRLILATLQTAATAEFLQRLQQGHHLMVVIDEVHRAGSPILSAVLSIDAGAKLGLSATPVRYGDPDGTNRIMNYFNGIVEPPFTLADAIAAGRLCSYTYHVHPVALTGSEARQWQALTRDLKRRLAASRRNDEFVDRLPEDVKMLLIRRARIVKNAAGKVPLAVEIIKTYYQEGHRWLIYCDDQQQLTSVMQALRDANYDCDEYHSSMEGSPGATLDHFTTAGGILVAIRCLDEGVDIPTIDHALILASSRNPREFIQRRGRVLRIAPDKLVAEIHDALVVPQAGGFEPDDVSILRAEIARALQFAENAENAAVRFHLRQLARDASIDLGAAVAHSGFEGEEVQDS